MEIHSGSGYCMAILKDNIINHPGYDNYNDKHSKTQFQNNS